MAKLPSSERTHQLGIAATPNHCLGIQSNMKILWVKENLLKSREARNRLLVSCRRKSYLSCDRLKLSPGHSGKFCLLSALQVPFSYCCCRYVAKVPGFSCDRFAMFISSVPTVFGLLKVRVATARHISVCCLNRTFFNLADTVGCRIIWFNNAGDDVALILCLLFGTWIIPSKLKYNWRNRLQYPGFYTVFVRKTVLWCCHTDVLQ